MNFYKSKLALAIAVFFVVPGVLADTAHATDYEFVPGKSGNFVRFESKATLESFKGETNVISGQLTLDPKDIGDSIGVYISIDLGSLDTGIDRRNEHMRKNHLETTDYPNAVFRGAAILTPGSLEEGKTTTFEIEGTLELHGVTKRLRTSVDVTLAGEANHETIRVVTSFPITLPDYNIERPKFLFLKLSEVQHITFDATATAKPTE